MENITSIGFVGTGSMGRPMIHELLKKGYQVKVFDRYRSAAESVIAAGAQWADSPKDAAIGCQIVITCLPLPQDVLENMLGDQGALEGMASGTTWIDTSTTDYHNTLRIAKSAKAKGVYSIEGPVSNLSHMGVDFANSSIYCAGDREGYDMSLEVLNTITKIAFYVGEIGSAQTTKLLTNLLFYGPVAIAGDCFAISQQAGIPNHWMWDFVKASKGNSVATEQFMPMLFDGSYDSSCTLEIGVKDMSLTVALADEFGLTLPLGRVINERYHTSGRVYDQQQGHLKICKLTEDANELQVRIAGFVAPTKYGINKQYVRSAEVVTDKYGRIKPKLPESYRAPAFEPDVEQRQLAGALAAFMEYTNYVFVKEAYELGYGIGIRHDLITEMILWSVGTCWVFENFEGYKANPAVLDDVAAIKTELHLPLIQDVLGIWAR
ncbi:NAD(P)-dependent oxidoreductase [Marinobacterium rhizophilum]